jgi:hypothetical protein
MGVPSAPETPFSKELPMKFPSVGHCIYCPATAGPIHDEHIVPEGLGGDHILQNASCVACEKITTGIEQFCLREMIGPCRYPMGFGNKRHKSRKADFPLGVTDKDGVESERRIPAEDYPPLMFCTLEFTCPPGILSGLPVSEEIPANLWFPPYPLGPSLRHNATSTRTVPRVN